MDSTGHGRLLGGRYRLASVIGQGGMGIVWAARDEFLDRDVAVKELSWPAHVSAAERQAGRDRAIREARAAARLSHRNVVRVFDIFEHDGSPCIVMELLPPRSLRDLIEQEGPLSPDRTARIGLQVLAALRAAHELGIVHRDVKPGNVLIAPGDRAVLADFGIARAVEATDGATTSMLIGSPAYIAPERARGGPSEPAGDLWGLGASLYAAVEGRGPFEREAGGLASLTAVIADDPEPAVHAGPLLGAVISGLLRKDPAKRLKAHAAERMLRRAAEPAPPPAPPTAPVASPARRRTTLTALIPGQRRNAQATTAALAGAAALAVATSVSAAVLSHPGAARPDTAPAAPSTHTASARTASTHPATAGTHPASVGPSAAPGTHLTSRTSPGPASRAGSGPAGPPAAGPASPAATAPAAAAPAAAAPVTPPGHSDKSGKPGKGKGRGNGKGKG